MTKTLRVIPMMTRTLSLFVAACLLVAAPGPYAAKAFASVVQGANASVSATVVPGVTAVPAMGVSHGLSAPMLGGSDAMTSLSASLPSVGVLPGAISHIPAAGIVSPDRALSRGNAASTRRWGAAGVIGNPGNSIRFSDVGAIPAAGTALNAPVRRAPPAGKTGIAPQARGRSDRVSVHGTLERGARELEKADKPSSRFSALKALFSGSSRRSGTSLVAADSESAPEARDSGLSAPAGIADLEAIAADPSQDLAARQKAVAQIAEQKSDEAKEAIIRISEANPEGGAQDYEVHRIALRSLADTYGDIRSLRPISEKHKQQILSNLEKDKPEMVISDYDDTLESFSQPVSPEIAQGLAGVMDAGVEMAILTDRKDVESRKGKDVSVIGSLKPMDPAKRSGLIVLSNRGLKTLLFDRKGRFVAVEELDIRWSDADRDLLHEARDAVQAKYGVGEFDGKTYFEDTHSYSVLLPAGTPKEALNRAAEEFQSMLAAKGLDVPVTGRMAKKETDPPYIQANRLDKSGGVVSLKSNRRVFESTRDLLHWGLPKRLAKAAFKVVGRVFVKRPISAKKTLLLGDQFFDARISDVGMAKGSPGSTIISVGGKADPRLDDVVVWPAEGREGSLEILGALGKQAPSEMNKKAIFGLFTQRTASIAAFILTSIAYPFLAVPIVGWAGYGILMSFGPLAGIATGPLNGLIADRLSARNGMALNTVIRVISSLALPVLAAFGYLNFTTLLIASFANGWLLSSIMTTENSYIKRLAGAKNVFTISNLAWMNYLLIQVVLGLIIGIGSIVDQWNPMIAFTINAAVNAFIVLPVIWFTMPKLSPQPKTLSKMEARIAAIEGKLDSAKEEAKEALEKELAELRDGIPKREAFLKDSNVKNQAAVDKAREELAKLKETKPEGIRARIKRFSSIRSLEADIALRTKTIRSAEAELAREVVAFKDKIRKIGKFLKNNWFSVALFAAGIGGYLALNTTLPIIGALVFWITTTNGFKVLWYGKGSDISPREKALEDKIAKAKEAGKPVEKSWTKELGKWKSRLPKALLLLSLIALMMYPLQYLALPKIAVLLVGQEAKALVMGQLLGSLFFGNLIANAAQARLPEIKLPLVGRVPVQRLIQAVVVGLGMTWVYTGLFAGNILAAAAAGAVIAGLMALASKLTKRAWLKFVGLGFAGIWIPYLAWGTSLLSFIPPLTAMMLALLGIGMAFGPAYTTLMGYFFGNAAKDKSGAMGGVQGSFFNAAVSGGYGVLALAASLLSPAFPPLLAAMGVLFLLAGLIYWRAPKLLPGLPKTLFHPKDKD